jgi:hypothetical protein
VQCAQLRPGELRIHAAAQAADGAADDVLSADDLRLDRRLV